jgi:transcriptional regulator with XRE-family HTH domain
MKQTAVAKATGMSRNALYLIFKGLSNPTEASLRAIANAIGLPSDYFLQPERGQQEVKPRLVLEIDLPNKLELSEGEKEMLRQRVRAFTRDLLKLIRVSRDRREAIKDSEVRK